MIEKEKVVEVEMSRLIIVVSGLLNELKDTELDRQLADTSNELLKEIQLKQDLAEMRRPAIKEYKKSLLLDYIKRHGEFYLLNMNRSKLKQHAEIGSYDVLYSYLAELIDEGLLIFDLNKWSDFAGSFHTDTL